MRFSFVVSIVSKGVRGQNIFLLLAPKHERCMWAGGFLLLFYAFSRNYFLVSERN